MIEISVREHKEKVWHFFLGKKFNSKAKLNVLVKRLILDAVAEEAYKDAKEDQKKRGNHDNL